MSGYGARTPDPKWPGGARIGKAEKPPKPKTCQKCGAYLIGSGPCHCRKG